MSLNQTVENESFNFIKMDEPTILIVVCSTYGNGDAPETANHFWRKIKNRNLPTDLFKNIRYAVMGLGDTNYDKFCNMGKNLDKRFKELGGERVLELHCADEATNMENTVDSFVEKVFNFLVT
jgi:sulfite reductase alpha subunit-like flavoprotein